MRLELRSDGNLSCWPNHPIYRIVFLPLGSCFSFQEPDFLVPSGDTHEARAGVHIEVPEVVPFDLQAYNVVFVSTARIMPSTRKLAGYKEKRLPSRQRPRTLSAWLPG